MRIDVKTFSDWIGYVFDRPVTDPAWYWDMDHDYWYGPAETIVDYVTQTFSQSGTVLSAFSGAQVNQGLRYVISFDCSNYMVALQGEEVSLLNRLRCIDAMATLFRDCFATRCTPHLSHLDEPGASPLNSICYMWWDTLPLHGLAYHHPEWPTSGALDRRILSVIEQGLSLNWDACIESSLHGFSEWRGYYDNAIQKTLDSFIKAKPDLRSELRRYALSVRGDYVA